MPIQQESPYTIGDISSINSNFSLWLILVLFVTIYRCYFLHEYLAQSSHPYILPRLFSSPGHTLGLLLGTHTQSSVLPLLLDTYRSTLTFCHNLRGKLDHSNLLEDRSLRTSLPCFYSGIAHSFAPASLAWLCMHAITNVYKRTSY